MISLLLTLISLNPVAASVITLPTTFIPGQTLPASQLNGNFSTIVNDYNGNITNANIASGAAIAASKISFSGYVFSTLTATQIVPNSGAMTANQVLGENGAATGIEGKTISGSTGLSVTPSAGTIALANTGVTGLTAGSGISLSGGTGNVTVSSTSGANTVQYIHTSFNATQIQSMSDVSLLTVIPAVSGEVVMPLGWTMSCTACSFSGTATVGLSPYSGYFFPNTMNADILTNGLAGGLRHCSGLGEISSSDSGFPSGPGQPLKMGLPTGSSLTSGSGTVDVYVTYYLVP